MSTGGINLSKEFFELLKAIGESKSKQEEDRIIQREIVTLKRKLESGPTGAAGGGHHQQLLNSKKRAKEFLVRLLYVEMLGHSASFGYIKAVEMAASASLYHKRTGYLVCACCLPPEHEFRFMLVNQMQRDLQSTNVLEVSGGLLACTRLLTEEMVVACATEVTKLLSHDSATIRKKAIICLHRFYQLADDAVPFETLLEHIRRLLCDKDPAVMGSVLNVIEACAITHATPFKDLVPSLVSILKQINEHRLPSEFDYHRVPAPWMQMMLVRILSHLGQADVTASNGMYEILHETLRNSDNGINAGYAISYECIKTIVAIYPNPRLLDAAGETISRFIQSKSHNLKYLGVTGLALIVEQHPQYAAQHQLAVMDCLEDADETLQRKTLDLLYRMTNPVNVEFIADKLIDFLSGTTDLFLKKNLTQRVCSIAERYAPNNTWYIRTITKLFEVSGDLVPANVAQNLMSLIAEGTGESDEADMLLRQNSVEIYVGLLREKSVASLPRILLETMAWCLGEYGYLSAICTVEEVMLQLCDICGAHKAKLSPSSRKFCVTAVMKLVAQAGNCPPAAAAVIDDYTRSRDVDLQQRCLEFQSILTNCPALLPEILPVDASAEDMDVDPNLSFLNDYVQQKLNQGARAYERPEDDDDDDDYMPRMSEAASTFNMTPYEKPQAPAQAMLAMSGMGAGTRSANQGVSLPPGSGSGANGNNNTNVPMNLQDGSGLALNTRNVANVWGKGGMAVGSAVVAAAPAAPAPAASAAWDSSSAASGYGGGGGSTGGSTYGQYGRSSTAGFGAPAPAPPPVKTAEQIRKEQQAAALFGGMMGGTPAAASPPAPAAATVPPPVVAAAPPPPAPAPAAAEVDLLDMMGWDVPAPAAAISASPAPDFDDVLSAAPPAPAPVETVDSDDDLVGGGETTSSAAGQSSSVDPFADAGLLGGFDEKPLPAFERSSKFEYLGSAMAPLPITTPQFGQKWGSCPATNPISLNSPNVTSLDDFMEICKRIGAHPVEAIRATNEGICAGMVDGGAKIALIHGKVMPAAGGAKVDVTIKSTDAGMGGSLALYLQTLLR